MTDIANDRDTISIDNTLHEAYRKLTNAEEDLLDAPFRTMKDVFMWAVCLGVQLNRRRPVTNKKIIFHWAQFDPQIDIPLLKAIAIADNRDINVLSSRNDILTIIEEYANAGVYELRAALIEEQGRPLWNLVEILSSKR